MTTTHYSGKQQRPNMNIATWVLFTESLRSLGIATLVRFEFAIFEDVRLPRKAAKTHCAAESSKDPMCALGAYGATLSMALALTLHTESHIALQSLGLTNEKRHEGHRPQVSLEYFFGLSPGWPTIVSRKSASLALVIAAAAGLGFADVSQSLSNT